MGKEDNIQLWKDIVVESIQYIKAEKIKAGTAPAHALDIEIYELVQRRVKSVLKMLVKSGDVIEGDTVNNKYYKINT